MSDELNTRLRLYRVHCRDRHYYTKQNLHTGSRSGMKRTKLPSLTILVCPLVVVATALPSFAVTYRAVLLHPQAAEQSAANGISGGSEVGYVVDASSHNHPALWQGTSQSYVDLLNPPSVANSVATAISGNVVAGYGAGDTNYHAVLWPSGPGSGIDLQPATGYNYTRALATTATTQVGLGEPTKSSPHAVLWHGSADSIVDLNPAGSSSSEAIGVDGDSQVGASGGHAVLWHGSADSAVDLNPSSSFGSIAYAVLGDTQVGVVESQGVNATNHAAKWNGTAVSMIDLNPANFASSFVYGLSTAGEVGEGQPIANGSFHALYWNGTAASAIDLHTGLTELGHNFSQSHATAINDQGVISGWGYEVGRLYAVLWIPESGVPTDYNNDGKIDMADYVYWRDGKPLFNETSLPGTINSQDYTAWRAHFGNAAASGSGILAGTAVPEPTALALFAFAIIATFLPRPGRSDSVAPGCVVN